MPAAAASVAAPGFAGPLSVIFIAGSAGILTGSRFCCAGVEELVTLLLSASVVGCPAVAIIASWRRLEGRFQWIRSFVGSQSVGRKRRRPLRIASLDVVEVGTRKAVRGCDGALGPSKMWFCAVPLKAGYANFTNFSI